jgi:hypothetical protein
MAARQDERVTPPENIRERLLRRWHLGSAIAEVATTPKLLLKAGPADTVSQASPRRLEDWGHLNDFIRGYLQS